MMSELVGLLAQYGLWLVFGLVVVERIGLPVPALPIMIIAGSLAADGRLGLVAVGLVALAGCMLGDAMWFAAGRRYGTRVLRLLCRVSLSPDACVKQSEVRFERWGGPLLLVAKFVPGLATMAAPVAGAIRLRWSTFLLFSASGSLIWIVIGEGLGWLFHAELERLFVRLEGMGGLAVEVLVAAFALYILFKWWQRRRLFARLRMARISVQDLFGLMRDKAKDGERPVVVDVRSRIARQTQPLGIPGALAVEMEAVAEHLKHLQSDREIILYCTCPNEESAAHVARLLMAAGFTRVRPLQGGLDAWIDAGYAVEALVLPGEAEAGRLAPV